MSGWGGQTSDQLRLYRLADSHEKARMAAVLAEGWLKESEEKARAFQQELNRLQKLGFDEPCSECKCPEGAPRRVDYTVLLPEGETGPVIECRCDCHGTLAEEILSFLDKHARISASYDPEWDDAECKYSSPDASELLYAAKMLEQGRAFDRPRSSWESGGYQPYTDSAAKAWHKGLLDRLEEARTHE